MYWKEVHVCNIHQVTDASKTLLTLTDMKCPNQHFKARLAVVSPVSYTIDIISKIN